MQSWVDVSNNEYGITWATLDAPLVEMGAINAEQGWMKSIKPSQTFFSYVMNNYWHTNYKADQEGVVTFHYSIQPHGRFMSEVAVKFGRECREPFIVVRVDPVKPAVGSLLSVEPRGVVVSSIKPIADGRSWWMQLYNTTDQRQSVWLKWNRPVHVRMYMSDLFENTLEGVSGMLDVHPFGTVAVRVNRQ